jgi:cell division transport system permease protein
MAVSTGYVVRETGVNLRRNPVMTGAAILTMFVSLTLLGSGMLIRQATNRAAVQWRGGVELSIFLQPNVTANGSDAIGRELATMPQVKKVRYVDKAQAYQEFKTMFATSPDLVTSLTVADMPPSYRVVPTRPEDVEAIGDQFANKPGVKEVVYAKDVIDRVRKDLRTKRNIAYALSLVVFLGATALIVNTIQLAIFSRRREIAVMKLVGATNWFIRVPFMLEGLIDGIVGAVLAFGATYLLRDTIASFVSNNTLLTQGNSLAITSGDAWMTGLLVLVVGAVVGAGGSAFAVRRYLAV